MGNSTIRNFIGKLEIEEGSMGVGFVLVARDKRLGDLPVCSVSIPFKSNAENMAVAECIAEAWNAGMR